MAEHTDAANSEVALALYRSTACAIQLQHQDAAERVHAFEAAFPEHPLVRQARWDFANYLYRKRDWKDAALAFDSLNTLHMSADQKLEMQFKRGHALFEMERHDDARLDLFAVMEAGESAGDFEKPARYYFSHISYLKGQPQVALEGFESLKDDPKLKRVVPIYVAQLLHETEQYDRLIDYAPVVFAEGIDLSKNHAQTYPDWSATPCTAGKVSARHFPTLRKLTTPHAAWEGRISRTRWDTPITKRRST